MFFWYYLPIPLLLYPIILYLKIYRYWYGSTNETVSELVQRMLDFSRHATILKIERRQLVTADSKPDKRNSASPSCQYHTTTQLLSREHPVYSLCYELLNIHRSLFCLFIQTWTIIHSVEKVGCFVKGSGHNLLILTESFQTVPYSVFKTHMYNSLYKCLSSAHLHNKIRSADVHIFYDSNLQSFFKTSQLELF